MFYQIFLSPQVKRTALISNKLGMSELPHKLTNDVRLKNLRNLGNIRKMPKLRRIIAH